MVEKLDALKDSKLISGWGVSLYTRSSLQKVISIENAHLINVPVNIFNKQFIYDDKQSETQISSKHLFARSAFAQGLILKSPEELARKNIQLAENVKFVSQRASSIGLSLAQFSVLFVLAQRSIRNVVVGFDNAKQLSALCVPTLLNDCHRITPMLKELFGLPDFLLARPETWATT